MTLQHPAERGGGERGVFERFSERVSNVTSSPLFFAACILMIAGVVAVHFVHVPVPWLILAGDALTSVNLLLLALLKNSERRAEHAIQQKLDAIAEAMLEHYEGEGTTAREDLRRAIRLEREL